MIYRRLGWTHPGDIPHCISNRLDHLYQSGICIYKFHNDPRYIEPWEEHCRWTTVCMRTPPEVARKFTFQFRIQCEGCLSPNPSSYCEFLRIDTKSLPAFFSHNDFVSFKQSLAKKYAGERLPDCINDPLNRLFGQKEPDEYYSRCLWHRSNLPDAKPL